MKPYYRLFIFLVLAACSGRHEPWQIQDLQAEMVSTFSEADWHGFITLTDDTRRLVELVESDRKIPRVLHRVHLAGARDSIGLMEGFGDLPHFLLKFVPYRRGWHSFKSSAAWAKVRGNSEVNTVRLPDTLFTSVEESDAYFFFRERDGKWNGSLTLSRLPDRWSLFSRFPANGKGIRKDKIPESPLVFLASEESGLLSWVLNKPSPEFSVNVSPDGARVVHGRHTVTVGKTAGSMVEVKPFTLYASYNRQKFRLPRGLSLPSRVHNLLQAFDYFLIICDNRGPYEVCRGEFILKE